MQHTLATFTGQRVLTRLARRRAASLSTLAALVLPLAGCRTPAPLPAVDLSAPGWTIREGQAVWRRSAMSAELAGELLVAIRDDDEALVQFSKNPMLLVSAQMTSNRWQVEFIPQRRRQAGAGTPPDGIIWLQLAACIRGASLPGGEWRFQRNAGGGWRLENLASGESLEGFLVPALPTEHVVRPGDNPVRIARHYGVSVSELVAVNPGIVGPAPLRLGQTLHIPTP